MSEVKGFLITLLLIALGKNSQATQEPSSTLFENNNFTTKLYSVLKETTNRSIVFSPYSLQFLGGVLRIAAGNSTIDEIKNTFHLTSNESLKLLNSSANEFQGHIMRNTTIKIATKIIVNNHFNIKSSFNETISKLPSVKVKQIDFDDKENAVDYVNKLIRKGSGNNIDKFLSHDSINSQTQIMLINTIFFRGLWKKPFRSTVTRKHNFWTSENTSKKILMMYKLEKFKYAYNGHLNARILEMEYDIKNLSMVILMPKIRSGLSDLENKLEMLNLVDICEELRPRLISLRFPKFKVKFSNNLNDVLFRMGASNMFTNKADFANLAEDGTLKISEVFHSAFVRVNEEGTEAAAATSISMVPTSLVARKMVTVNHPFVFFIKYKSIILFMGRFKG